MRKKTSEAVSCFNEGDILVIPSTNNDLLPIMKKATAIVVEEDGLDCHAAIVGMALEIPVIVGAASVTDILKTGTLVTVDASRGIIQGGIYNY